MLCPILHEQTGVVRDHFAMPFVEDYLKAIVDRDWDSVRAQVAEDIVRRGPMGDTFRGRERYVRYLSELFPHLENYAMHIDRVTYTDDGRRAFAELREDVTLNGEPSTTHEVLVLELDDAGLISQVAIYMRRSE